MSESNQRIVGGLITAKTMRQVKRDVKRRLDTIIRHTERKYGIKIVDIDVSKPFRTSDGLMAVRVAGVAEEFRV